MTVIKKKINKYRRNKYSKKNGKVKKILKAIKKKGITSIEQKMCKILADIETAYIREAPIKGIKGKRFYDFYVYSEKNNEVEYEFLIECHGEYWHKAIFNESGIMEKMDITKKKKLTNLQKRNIKNDKYKILLAKLHKLPLLIFYESEIMKNPKKVENRIKNEIEKQLNKEKINE